MILLQCKCPEIDSSVQEWKEIEQFMNFTKQTGMKWAKAAGASAIFTTGRVPREHKSSHPTELEVDGVHLFRSLCEDRKPRKLNPDNADHQQLDSCQHHVLLTEMP